MGPLGMSGRTLAGRVCTEGASTVAPATALRVPQEAADGLRGAVHIAFRFPNGRCVRRRFLPDASLLDAYAFVEGEPTAAAERVACGLRGEASWELVDSGVVPARQLVRPGASCGDDTSEACESLRAALGHGARATLMVVPAAGEHHHHDAARWER